MSLALAMALTATACGAAADRPGAPTGTSVSTSTPTAAAEMEASPTPTSTAEPLASPAPTSTAEPPASPTPTVSAPPTTTVTGSPLAETGEVVEPCQDGLRGEESTDSTGGINVPPAAADDVIQLAITDLAERLGVACEEVTVVRVESVEWPDTSLGNPQPGMVYAQVITPGYKLGLSAQGGLFRYHTDKERVILVQYGPSE